MKLHPAKPHLKFKWKYVMKGLKNPTGYLFPNYSLLYPLISEKGKNLEK